MSITDDELYNENQRGNNRYTNQLNPEESLDKSNEYNQALLNILRAEFPDDDFYRNGRLTPPPPVSRPKTFSETQKDPTKFTMADRNPKDVVKAVAGTDAYVEYDLIKTYPTIDEEELDELLDEEWDTFEDPDDDEDDVLEPAVDGLFLVNSEVDMTDFHDLYIRYGPQNLVQPEDTENEIDEATMVERVFCVFFIHNGVARPIPTYKTLEVMLVERGLTYEDINEATPEEVKEFDLLLDGDLEDPEDRALADIDGDDDVSPLEEFRFRQMINRDATWTPHIRYRSGYEIKAPFLRDPGDYIKPESIRAPMGRIAEDESGEELPPDIFQAEDPEDRYFDQVFQKQTYKEMLREKYEGKMIVLDWPNPYDQEGVTRGTAFKADDQTNNVRMLVNGFWKKVENLATFRMYAAVENHDLGDLSAPQDAQIGDDTVSFNAIYGENGAINLLIRAGGIERIRGTSEEYDNSQAIPPWNDFMHIVEADDDGRQGLDEDEYKEYLENYSNGNNMFLKEHLEPYEPAGSVHYYNKTAYAEYVEQALQQIEIDAIKDQIKEIWPMVASRLEYLKIRLDASPDNFAEHLDKHLGPKSDLYKVMIAKSGNYKLIKSKRKGKKIKTKKSSSRIFKLCSKSTTIKWSMNESTEEKIVSEYKWMKTVERDKFAAWLTGGTGEDDNQIPSLGTLVDEGDVAAAATLALSGRMDIAYVSTVAAAEVLDGMLDAGQMILDELPEAIRDVAGGAGILASGLVGANLILGGGLAGIGGGAASASALSGLFSATGGPGLSMLVTNPFFAAAAVGVAAFAIIDWAAGEVKPDKHEMPPWRFMDDDWYLKACIWNQVDDQVTELAKRCAVMDMVFPIIKSDFEFLYNNMWMVDSLLDNSTQVEGFQAANNLLSSTRDSLDIMEEAGVMEEAINVQDDVENLLKSELRKQYKAIQFIRKQVYKKAGLWNRKNFGIKWSKGAKKILNKHVPGQKFDNYLPKGVKA